MQTAVIYARYSSDSQNEQSIEGQLRVCEEYAKRNGILILNTYIDRAMTGRNDNRPDFQRMLKDSNRKEWNYIIVYKFDRFARNRYETAIHKKELKDNGVKVLSAMENIPDTPEAIIFESMLEGYAEYYSAELAQKVKRGMFETRRKGLYQGGGLLYGYKIDGRKIVIDENNAAVVRFMYEQYANGVFVKDIIKTLTKKNVFYKGKPFVRNSVYNILRNEKYSGVYKHGDEVVDNMYPQIVPTEIFNQVRRKVDANKYGKKSLKIDFLLRQKLICGNCGQPMHGESGTTKNGSRIYYYKCYGRKRRLNDCNKSMIRKEVIERLVTDTIVQKLSEPSLINILVSKIMQRQEKSIRENSSLSLLIKQKKQVDISIDNIVAAIERGIVTNATNARLQSLETQQQELERQILIEQSKQSVKLSATDIKQFYASVLNENSKILINLLIEKIILFDDKVEIYFNTPIKNPNDTHSGFILYSKVVEMIVSKYANTKPVTRQILLEIIV